MPYYDGTKLLSLKDINGNHPEIYICTTNRTGGKTTWFNSLLVRHYLKRQNDKVNKFMLLYRYKYELDSVEDKFFKDIQGLFFPQYEMTAKKRAEGIYQELFLNGISCGYAVSINSADQIKKHSHLFNDTAEMLMDEFQSETNSYCPKEISKFISIHTSVARGNGKQVRRVPVYMIGNPVSLINPYYTALGISSRIKTDTRFLRGNGFVLEQGYVDSAAEAQKESAFNKAFASEKTIAYNSQGIYLNDNTAFISKPSGRNKYLATIKYQDTEYAIREFPDAGIIYCDTSIDRTFKTKIAITTNDHDINYIMIKRHDLFFDSLRFFFEHGCFRFKDLKCKEVIMKALSYSF